MNLFLFLVAIYLNMVYLHAEVFKKLTENTQMPNPWHREDAL